MIYDSKNLPKNYVGLRAGLARDCGNVISASGIIVTSRKTIQINRNSPTFPHGIKRKTPHRAARSR